MKLTDDERAAIVAIRREKAQTTLHEAQVTMELKLWNTAVNRLYYACYYEASALLIFNGFTAQTHSGVISLLGMHFVSKGVISKEMGRFYQHLFELRQTGDYNDFIEVDQQEIIEVMPLAKDFIAHIEQLFGSIVILDDNGIVLC